jgi:monomeric isocitrate dehydrogenase
MTQKSKIFLRLLMKHLWHYSFLPIVQAFTGTSDIEIETRDISLWKNLSIFRILTEEKNWRFVTELDN